MDSDLNYKEKFRNFLLNICSRNCRMLCKMNLVEHMFAIITNIWSTKNWNWFLPLALLDTIFSYEHEPPLRQWQSNTIGCQSLEAPLESVAITLITIELLLMFDQTNVVPWIATNVLLISLPTLTLPFLSTTSYSFTSKVMSSVSLKSKLMWKSCFTVRFIEFGMLTFGGRFPTSIKKSENHLWENQLLVHTCNDTCLLITVRRRLRFLCRVQWLHLRRVVHATQVQRFDGILTCLK